MRPLLGLEGEKLLRAITSEVSTLGGSNKRLRDFLDLYESLYFLKPKKERPIGLGMMEGPSGLEVITNDASNAVNVMSNLLAEARVHRWVISQEPGEQALSDKAELFYNNVLYQTRRRMGRPQLTLARNDQSMYGRGCLYPYWEATRAYLGPALARINPRSVLWERGDPMDEYAAIVVETKRPVMEVEYKYKVSLHEFAGYDKEAKYRQKVTVYDVWKWEKVKRRITRTEEMEVEGEEGTETKTVEREQEIEDMVVVNCIVTKETVLKEPEPMPGYKHLPVVTFGAYPTGHDSLEYEFIPISFFIHTAILMERRLRTLQFKRLDQMLRLPMTYKSSSAQLAKAMTLELGTYNIWPIGIQEEVGFPEWRGSPADVENLGRFLDSQRQKGSFTDLALGEMIMISGVAASRFWQGNVLKMAAPAEQYGWGMERVLNMFRDFAIRFAGDRQLILEQAPTGKAGPGVFDIKGGELRGTKVVVEVTPAVPADIRYRDSREGLELLRLGKKCPFPLAYVLERWFHIEQPEVMLKQKREEIEQYGDVIAWLTAEEEKGRGQEEETWPEEEGPQREAAVGEPYR